MTDERAPSFHDEADMTASQAQSPSIDGDQITEGQSGGEQAAPQDGIAAAFPYDVQIKSLSSRLCDIDDEVALLRQEVEEKGAVLKELAQIGSCQVKPADCQGLFDMACLRANALLTMDYTLLLRPTDHQVWHVCCLNGDVPGFVLSLTDGNVSMPAECRDALETGAWFSPDAPDYAVGDWVSSLGVMTCSVIPVKQFGVLVAVLVSGRNCGPDLPAVAVPHTVTEENVHTLLAYVSLVLAQVHAVEMETLISQLRQEVKVVSSARDQADARAEAKSTYTAVMSHELRTPMNGVIGLGKVLLGTPLSSHQREIVETLVSSSETLLSIANEVLDFSKLEAGQIRLEETAFDPLAVIEDCLSLFSGQVTDKGLCLASLVDKTVPRLVIGDPLRLRQIVLNLVGNAIKFTDVGHVVVELRQDDTPFAEGPLDAAHQQGSVSPSQGLRLRLTVTDSGIGIPLKIQQRLFSWYEQGQSFISRKYGGTGIGLAISRKLVELMNGSLTVQSMPGQGATFTAVVSLAAAPDQDRPAVSRAAKAGPAGVRGRPVVVAEPDPVVRALMVRRLETWGAVVHEIGTLDQLADCGYVMGQGGLVIATTRLGPDCEDVLRHAAQAAGAQVCALILVPGHVERYYRSGVVRLGDPYRESAFVAALDWLTASPIRRDVGALSGMRQHGARISATSGHAAESRKITALVADDNDVNRSVAIALLEQRGMAVLSVEDGAQVLDALNRFSIDVVLLDRYMPGMNGIEVVRRIRSKRGAKAHVPVIALSAAVSRQEAQQCLDAGMDGFVSKPIDPDHLYSVIGSVLKLDWISATPAADAGRGADAMVDHARSDKGDHEAVTEHEDGFDRTIIRDLIADLSLNTVHLLVREFQATGTDMSRAIDDAVQQRNAVELERAAHSMKSAAGYLGMSRLVCLSAEIEAALRSGDTSDGVYARAAHLPQEIDAAYTWLAGIIKSYDEQASQRSLS